MLELQAVFPEINADKLKSAMFDLMMKIEEGGVDDAHTSYAPPAPPNRPDPQVRADEPTGHNPVRSIVGEPVGWGDLAGNRVPVDTQAGFEFETVPTPTKATGKKGRLSKEEKEARRQEANEFTGLSDLEIARRLTDSVESKQKKTGGQFTNLGSDGPAGDEEFVVG